MQVTERMQALGDHAKSSRQPPLKERKSAKADESAAKQDVYRRDNFGERRRARKRGCSACR